MVIYNDHMTITVTATEAKAKILKILDDVAGGAEYEITKRGSVVARLVPASRAPTIKAMFAETVKSNASDEDLFTTDSHWDLPVQ